jgi:hypothetical protein
MRVVAFVLLLSILPCFASEEKLIESKFLNKFAHYMWVDNVATPTKSQMEIFITINPPAIITVVDNKKTLYLEVDEDFTVTGTCITYEASK